MLNGHCKTILKLSNKQFLYVYKNTWHMVKKERKESKKEKKEVINKEKEIDKERKRK